MAPPPRPSGTSTRKAVKARPTVPGVTASSRGRRRQSSLPASAPTVRASSSPDSGPPPGQAHQVSPGIVTAPIVRVPPSWQGNDDESMNEAEAVPPQQDRTMVEQSCNPNQNRAVMEVAGQVGMDESEMLLYVSMNVKLHYFAYKKFLGGTLISKEETRLQLWMQKQLKLTNERLEQDWSKIRTQVAKTLRSKRSAVTTEIKDLFLGKFSCLLNGVMSKY